MTIQKITAGANENDPLASTGAQVATAVNGLIDSTLTPASSFGALPNGAEAAAALSAHTKSISFDAGEYLVTNWSFSNSNVVIQGSSNGETVLANATTGRVLTFSGSVSNVTFKNITFKSNFVSAAENLFGLVTANGASLLNIRFENCRFAAPSQNINAVKLIAEGAARASGVYFDRCQFKDIGRMAVEIQNHTADTVVRYDNIHVRNCLIQNTGLNGTFGMGVSLSGYGSGCSVKNTKFANTLTVGIEGVGVSNSEFHYNEFTEQSRASNPLSFSNTRPMTGNSFVGNFSSSTINGSLVINNNSNAVFCHNRFGVSGSFTLNNSSNNDFRDCVFNTAGNYSVFITGTSNNNSFIHCNLNNVASTANFAVVRFDGASTVRNVFESCNLTRGTGGAFADQINGAAGNFLLKSMDANGVRINVQIAITLPDADTDISTQLAGVMLPVVIRLNGTLTATRTITLPNYNDGICVHNNSGQSVLLKAITGSTTPALVTGTRGIFIFDGANAQLY